VSSNGIPLTTTYVSSTSLTAQIPASAETTGGSLNITVANPNPGGGQSDGVRFQIVAGTLAISVVDLPAGANAAISVSGPASYSAHVTGSQTLQNLALGTYTLTANSVHIGTNTYTPTTPLVTANLTGTATVNAVVDYYTVQPDTTKILDPVGLSSLLLGADQNTLIITGQSAVAQSLNPGDILVVGPTTAIRAGKVVQVNAVSISAGWYIVLNSPATLMDAFQQYAISASQQLDSNAITNVSSLAKGTKVFRRARPDQNTANDGSSTDPCANQSIVYSKTVDTPLSDDPTSILNDVTLSGTMEFCPSIVASLNWSWGKLNGVHFEVDLGEDADVTATLAASESFDNAEIELFEAGYPTFFVGVVPVTPTVSFYAGASGNANASLSVEASQSASVQAGFDYANGISTPINSFSNNISAAGPPQLQADAQIKGYLRSELAADLAFGLIDPYVSVSPYVQANVDVTANPWWTIDYGLDGKLGIDGDVTTLLGVDPSWSTNIFGPYVAFQAPGPFLSTPADITGITPPQPVSSANAQALGITGTNLSVVTALVLCSSGACNTVMPASATSSSVGFRAVLTPGQWTIQATASDFSENSNIFRFAVYPPPTAVIITALSSNVPSMSSSPQTLSFTGTGFESGAQITLCFVNLCLNPLTAQVSSDGDSASATSALDHAGLWTARLLNPDGSSSSAFSFIVAGPLSATVAPTAGLITATDFKASGAGATPGKTVVLTETSPGGSPLQFTLTADSQGNFSYGPFVESSEGAYTLVFTDQTTGSQSPPLTIVASRGIQAQISPAIGTANSTYFTVTGWGATAGATVRSTVVPPSGVAQNTTATASASGSFTFGPFQENTIGTYSGVFTDTANSGMTPPVTWTVGSAASLQAQVSPTSGVVNSTAFTLSGKGASPSGGVTALVTNPDNTNHVYHAQASSGVFSFSPMVETVSGNYASVISDDLTGTQSALISWTVNPNTTTKLQTISVTPTSWAPVFAPGSTAVAVMPLVIAGGTGAFTGTITSNQSWLLADGHQSGTWIAPESITLSVNPTGLTTGSNNATLTITSSSATNSPVTIPVTPLVRQPLQVTAASLPDILGGYSYSFQFNATGGTGTGYKWTVESGYLPPGLSLDSTTGVMSGIPVLVANTQTLNFSIQVEDSSGTEAYAWFTATYRPGLFVLDYSPSNFAFYVGNPYYAGDSITVPTFGGVAPITLTSTAMPPGLSLNSTTGLISGTPTKPGNYSVTFTAQDPKSDTASATFVLPVLITSLAISPAVLPSAQVGISYQQYLAGSGGSQSGYAWSIQGNVPPGLRDQIPAGCTECSLEIYGTPTAAGSYPITVTLTDSLGDTVSQSMTLIVTIGPPPQLPAVILPLGTVGTLYSYPFVATSGTPPYTWSVNGSIPDPGLQLSAAGTLGGTPTIASACPSGASGMWYGYIPPETFQIKVTDATGQSAIQQYCIGVFYPTPQVSAVTPTVVTANGIAHTLTVTGLNFTGTSEVLITGSAPLLTQFVDMNHLAITLQPTTNALFAISTTSSYQVPLGASSPNIWVAEPGAYFSNQNLSFTIADPVPAITSVQAVLNNSTSPCTPNLNCQLIITGAGLVFDTQYSITGLAATLLLTSHPNTVLPWSSITTSSFSVPTAGTYTVVISNPNQAGGGTATAQGQFTVVP
jgi:hypothetical protein